MFGPTMLIQLLIINVVVVVHNCQSLIVEQCDIFCHGPLLDAVQKARLFDDSKHFVDMTLKADPNITLQAFHALSNKTDPDVLRAFLQLFFDQPGSELELCDPVDWTPRPESFKRIRDPYYRLWATMINQKWHKLCRKVKDVVHENPQRYSLIPIPNPLIIPGGRFREYYYWDSYWIIKGLLASDMPVTAAGMIHNLASMVDRFGFVPNGGRIYYLTRTQPPLLTRCVYDYFNHTGDAEFVRQLLPLLEKEYDFWKRERSVMFPVGQNQRPVRLYQYRVYTNQPRPESYREDMQTAAFIPTSKGKEQLWSDIAASCESGWDFTSRWFGRTGRHRYTLKSVRTSRVVPVDLNAHICGNHLMMSKLYRAVGDDPMAIVHGRSFQEAKQNMQELFWDPVDRIWYDLDLDSGMRVPVYYSSNLVPLFTGCYDDDDAQQSGVEQAVVDYLKDNEIVNTPHGVPTSFTWTDEQWDRPNGWAPNNHMVIEGLRRSANAEAQQIAFGLAQKWLELNFGVYLRSDGKMFEKYNVENGYAAGGGGEYDVQEGFGWTNGVALDLMITYGDRLTVPFVPADQIAKGSQSVFG